MFAAPSYAHQQGFGDVHESTTQLCLRLSVGGRLSACVELLFARLFPRAASAAQHLLCTGGRSVHRVIEGRVWEGGARYLSAHNTTQGNATQPQVYSQV